jgi:sulfur carrier protein
MMKLKVNGVEEELAVTTVSELLAFRGIDPIARSVAVAVNGSVVRRSDWSSKPLEPGDGVEIVRPFSGG